MRRSFDPVVVGLWVLVVMAWGFAITSVMALACPAHAAELWQLKETRYCGVPARNDDGSIKRSSSVLATFRRIHPCPGTGAVAGACPGWAINHVIPLACGGCDAVSNLDWMPDEIKSCGDPWCRDRWERKVYGSPDHPGTEACQNRVLTWTKP